MKSRLIVWGWIGSFIGRYQLLSQGDLSSIGLIGSGRVAAGRILLADVIPPSRIDIVLSSPLSVIKL